MSIPLRVLMIEDSEDDTLLLLRQLRRDGYDPIYSRVDTAEAMGEALDEQEWDIVIADYAMPSFSASAALSLLKQKGFDLPFIVVSGAIGEETAVALMKEGAHDFLTKNHLARLVPAIERELGDAKGRRQRKDAEEALRKRTHDLDERVKELNCLYNISELVERSDFSWEQVFQGIVDVIPSGLQYPEVGCARIVLDNLSFETENFLETNWKLAKDIIVYGEHIGYVEACDLEGKSEEAGGPFLEEKRGLINAIAERLGRVIERERSEENIRALSQQLLRAHEIERQKIASDLHDSLGADLSALKIGIDTLFGEGEIITEEHRKRASGLSKSAQQIITVVRDMAYELHPAGLQELGLVDTLRSYCEDFARRYHKKVDFFSVGVDQADLDFETQIIVYRSVQEGLTNVRKHADADQITVRLSASYPHIMLRIEDDGKGFDPERRLESVSKGKHMGLLSMEQRVAYLNGEMIIESRPMQGTKILIKFPFQEIT